MGTFFRGRYMNPLSITYDLDTLDKYRVSELVHLERFLSLYGEKEVHQEIETHVNDILHILGPQAKFPELLCYIDNPVWDFFVQWAGAICKADIEYYYNSNSYALSFNLEDPGILMNSIRIQRSHVYFDFGEDSLWFSCVEGITFHRKLYNPELWGLVKAKSKEWGICTKYIEDNLVIR